jgi:hypothetical protein
MKTCLSPLENITNRLLVSDNKVLRRIYGPKGEEVTGEWRKLRNLYCSLNIIRAIKSRGWDERDMWHAWENEK